MGSIAAEEGVSSGTLARQDGQPDSSIFAGYSNEQMPLGSYATLVGVYHAAFAGFLAAAKGANRPLPERLGLRDILLLGVATHKLSRIITRDWVTSPLRAPFTEYQSSAGAGEVNEKARGEGMRRALGDLLTCPWCMGPWVAAALAYGFVLKPRTTRLVGGIFAAVALSDYLHHVYDALKERNK